MLALKLLRKASYKSSWNYICFLVIVNLLTQSGYAVTAVLKDTPHPLIIDRTFIDSTTAMRWVIDYKTTHYQGNKPEDFLKLEMQRHCQQLNTYASVLLLGTQHEASQRLCGSLYFPFTSLWCEWEFTEVPIAESV